MSELVDNLLLVVIRCLRLLRLAMFPMPCNLDPDGYSVAK